jgi:hypothetical protein
VLIPDKLLVTEVALQGPVVRVPERLWYRRLTASFDTRRQRRSIFVDGSRLLARVPWPLVHAGSLAWNLGVKGTLAPTVPQREGATIAAEYLAANGIAITEKVARRAKKTALRRGRALRRGVEALQRGTAAR